jgi:hypothetical protein
MHEMYIVKLSKLIKGCLLFGYPFWFNNELKMLFIHVTLQEYTYAKFGSDSTKSLICNPKDHEIGKLENAFLLFIALKSL